MTNRCAPAWLAGRSRGAATMESPRNANPAAPAFTGLVPGLEALNEDPRHHPGLAFPKRRAVCALDTPPSST